MKGKKLLLLVCLVCTLASLFTVLSASAAAEPVKLFGTEGPAPADGSINMSANMYIMGTRFEVKDGKMVGFQLDDLSTVGPVKGILRIYKWKEDYQKTTSEKPLVQQLIDVTATEAQFETYVVNFDGVYAEGEYLATVQSEGPMFLWTHQLLDGIHCYLNGTEYTYGTFKVSYLRDVSATVKSSDQDFDASVKINTEQVIPAYGMGANLDETINFQLFNYYNAATRFTVSEGKFLGIVLDDAVMMEDDTELVVWVYPWNQDYETTVAGTPKYYGSHLLPLHDGGDPVDTFVRFDRAFAEGEYLVVLEAMGPISVWSHGLKDGVSTYFDEKEWETATMKIGYIADASALLDERPVETPTPSPEPTATPEITGTPVVTANPTSNPTPAPSSQVDGDSAESESGPMVWIVLAAVAVVAIVVVILIVGKKRSRKA